MTYFCGRLGCATYTTAIYCDKHREEAAAERLAAREAAAAAAKERMSDPEFQAKLQAARAAKAAPATEGK